MQQKITGSRIFTKTFVTYANGDCDRIRTLSSNQFADLMQQKITGSRIFTKTFVTYANGDCDRIRTCDRPLRRRMLYPTELRSHE
jgi:hypothetical protein